MQNDGGVEFGKWGRPGVARGSLQGSIEWEQREKFLAEERERFEGQRAEQESSHLPEPVLGEVEVVIEDHEQLRAGGFDYVDPRGFIGD